MVHAFLRHPSHIREWGRAVGQFNTLYEIFTNTNSLVFAPNEMAAAAYRAFALAEIARLGGSGPDRLMCRHGAARHIAALKEFIAALPRQRAN
ncbi:MAG: hypothetical protein IT406_03645 [Candidatus Yanofskybacteria bacterium]|nr:hypothetical protein [Candidatus Yanofskybacteria bacterium]